MKSNKSNRDICDSVCRLLITSHQTFDQMFSNRWDYRSLPVFSDSSELRFLSDTCLSCGVWNWLSLCKELCEVHHSHSASTRAEVTVPLSSSFVYHLTDLIKVSRSWTSRSKHKKKKLLIWAKVCAASSKYHSKNAATSIKAFKKGGWRFNKTKTDSLLSKLALTKYLSCCHGKYVRSSSINHEKHNTHTVFHVDKCVKCVCGHKPLR